MRPDQLRVEWLADPLGIDEAAPRLSWILTSDRCDDVQTGYQIVVASTPDGAAGGSGDVWDTGRVPSPETFGIPYAGRSLSSRQRCWWSVRVWDGDGNASDWAPAASWEMGLLDPSDWQATWVAAPAICRRPVEPPDGVDLGDWRGIRPTLLRREFVIDAPVVRARAYVTALGVYELHLNGERVGSELLRPGWTDYTKRLQYQVYDVGGLIHRGDNAMGLLLGSGWFAGRVAWFDRVYGEIPGALVQLEIEDADGRKTFVTSDGDWRATTSPLLWADLLIGEAHDCHAVRAGWSEAAHDDQDWLAVEILPAPDATIVAERGPGVRRLAELPAQSIAQHREGVFMADLGQNIAGWTRISLPPGRGQVIRIRHGEALDADGGLHTANLRTALATDVVILGDTETVFEPHFTVHGFRYVEITGLTTPPASVVGVAVGSDVPEAGTFSCSHPFVNKLHENIRWSQRANFLEVPTDCPQRDERLGWTADAQVFLPTACYLADVAAFFGKWTTDLLDTARPDGAVADVAPLIRPENFAVAAPGWGDAIVLVPWHLYRTYGDRRVLERAFPAMCGWIERILEANPSGLWLDDRGNDYGDWLAVGSITPKDLVATACLARCTRVVAAVAEVLGRKEDHDRWIEAHRLVRQAFIDAYVTPTGRIVGHNQTAYALALSWDLLPEELRPLAAAHLADDVAGGYQAALRVGEIREPWQLTTGFLGTPELLGALSESGYLDAAYRLLEQENCPSWLFPVTQGATTIWERWDGWRRDTGFKDHPMNSLNHYAFGAVGRWLYETVAGLAPSPEAIGFDRVVIRPRPGGSITSAAATYDSVRGRIATAWSLDPSGRFSLEVTIPPNVVGEVWLPTATAPKVIGSGSHTFEDELAA